MLGFHVAFNTLPVSERVTHAYALMQDARWCRHKRDAVYCAVLAVAMRIEAGEWLPNTRQMAGLLGVARGTVAAVYERLEDEGYLTLVGGRGGRVNAVGPVERAEAMRLVGHLVHAV